MENFLLSLNVVLPLFLEMALGYAIRCFRLVDEPTLRKMNNVVFRVFLPILLFYNVISTDIGTAFNGPLMLTAVLFVLGEFALCMALVPLLQCTMFLPCNVYSVVCCRTVPVALS